MKRLKEWNASKASLGVILGVVFGFMLVLNFLTPYIADDYVYMFSFATKQRLASLSDILRSMYVHCFTMNGRVVSHTLEQIFMLMPKAVFNLCNALVFTAAVYLMYRIANLGRRRNGILLCVMGMALWCFMPAFGQVALWQVGALNYLWGLLGLLLFLCPYLYGYFRGKELLPHRWQRIVFSLGALLFGMYNEITSFVGIYLAGALMILSALGWKNRRLSWRGIAWILSCAGYVIMLCMPAELPAKQAGAGALSQFVTFFQRANTMLWGYCRLLLLLWCAFFALSLYQKTEKKTLIAAVLLLTGALGANYMTIVAQYYPERCLCTTVLLLIISIGMLLSSFRPGRVFPAMLAVFAVFFCLRLYSGWNDILTSYEAFSQREAEIETAKAEGRTQLELNIITPQTQYSPFWDLRDLSREQANTWPNSSMAKYYGVDSIIGK